MRKFYFLLIASICFIKFSIGQTYTWNGSVSTDYKVAANWTPNRTMPLTTDNLSFNAMSALDISNVANETIGSITIAAGTSSVSFSTDNPLNVLTISGATPLVYTTAGSILAADFLTIRLSSSSTISQGTFGITPLTGGKIIIASALTLNSAGILDFDVAGTGGTTITGSIRYLAGTFNSVNAGAINWASTATYFHAFGGVGASAIPASTWSPGSTCSVTGMNLGTTAPTIPSSITFANFTWNCTSQFGDVDFNLPATTLFINGALTIASTGTGIKYLRLAGAAGGSISAGTYNQTGGNLMLQSSTGTTTLIINGAFTHSAGILDGVGNGGTGTANLNLKGNVNKSGGTWNSSSSSNAAQMNIEFSGAAVQNVAIAGTWTTTAAGRSNIIISNTVSVALTSGSTLKVYSGSTTPATCTVSGILSPQSATAIVAYIGTGTLIYSGASLQTATAAEFPTLANTPTNLTINNGLGVTLPAGFSRTIPGTLTLQNGNFEIGAGNILDLNNTTLATQLTYTGGFITLGTLRRLFPAAGLPTSPSQSSLFPFGIGANDRSLNIFFPTGSVSVGGTIAVSHTPVVNRTLIGPLADNGVDLDKRTNTFWTISAPGVVLTGNNVSITAVGANIGAIDSIAYLRLTDGTTANLGTLIPSIGTTSTPTVGKSGLNLSALNTNLYIGSDGTTVYNPLLIITFTWTGLGVNNNWTNSANWTSPNTVGYPSASTEEAVITNIAAPLQPTINSVDNISVYRLTVGAGMTLTMLPSSIINVFDVVSFAGTATFDRLSTFTYASSSSAQTALNLMYGSLAFSGTASKILPTTITITGSYAISGASPNVTANLNTFIYAGSASQNVTAASYYNLTITGDRLNTGVITLGPSSSATVTINIANIFDVSGLSNYLKPNPLSPRSFTTVKFTSAGSQIIPGFQYAFIENSNGPRTLDNQGSTTLANVIYCNSFSRGTGVYTVTGSKVNLFVSGAGNVAYFFNENYNDLEISGDLKNFRYKFNDGYVEIAGKFTVSLTNYKQDLNQNFFFSFNGLGDQTITSFKTNTATNTPAFRYSKIIVTGGNRNVTLAGLDTIKITGSLQVPRLSPLPPYDVDYNYFTRKATVTSFSAGKGFIVSGSTVNFSSGSGFIPELIPSGIGTYNYNNIDVSSGNRIVESNNMTIGGNLSVGVDSATTTAGVLSPATIKIGDGGVAPLYLPRVFNVLGNVTASAATVTALNTAQIDLNPGTFGSTTLNVSKSLFLTTQGQITGTGESNGTIVFKGVLPHTYTSTSTLKNGFVNFQIGDGIINNYSKLTLLSTMDLVRSGFGGIDIPKIGTLTVLPNDSLDCGIYNVVSNLTNGTNGNAKFDLQANATLITANTGGIEGTASSSSTGSIINDATMARTYNATASYVFNAPSATNMNFPALPATFPMANLTIGDSTNPAIFNLNKPIAISNILTLRRNGNIELGNFDVTLISTTTNTARVAPVQISAGVSYTGIGRFNVERNYRGLRRAWYLVTSPLTEAGSVFDTWQKNTYVTGTIAGTAANGLDDGPQKNSSLKAGNVLTAVNDTKATLLSSVAASAANKGFFLFVRGTRIVSNWLTSSYDATTLSSRGKIQIGSQTFNLPSVAGFELVGNPYASPVSYTAASKTNLNSIVMLWDPYLNSTLGGYVTVVLDGSGIVSSATTPAAYLGGMAIVGQPLILQSSQAFWVQTTGSGASITFNEANKSAAFNVGTFRPMRDLTKSFRTNLNLVEPNDSIILADGNFVQFDNQYSKGIDLNDALKFSNIKETFGLLRDGKALAVERRPEIAATDTLFFKLTKTERRNYQFQFVPTNMAGVLTAFLEDSYTKAKTIVSLTATSTFNFTINGDAASAAADRFRIVFTASAAGPLPVTYKTIKAYQQGNNIAVDWTVENEINISKYEVEKSTTGVNFTKVNTITAKGTSGSIDYTFIDTKTEQGNNFYRIKNYNQSGSFDYSRVVLVKLGKGGTGISVYPNPVSGNSIGLAMTNMDQGIYQARLINTIGQTVMTKRINHSSGNSMETLTPDSQLSTGIYQLEITAPDKRMNTTKVIVQ